MNIDRNLVQSLSPDTSSFSAGEGLVKKSKFTTLNKDADNTLLFGECSGSGSKPYVVSVDFIVEESPVFRCSCPSRKFPCKHAIGLMIACADGKTFTQADVPPDIVEKREKIQKKEEKLKAVLEEGDTPKKSKKVNTSALKKKIEAQLAGLDIADTLIMSIVRDGFGALTPKSLNELEKQAKQMGDHYLPGVQKALIDLGAIFDTEDTEQAYTNGYEQILSTFSLVKKGREYLKQRLENLESPIDSNTEIEALLGHAWTLEELLAAGRVEKSAQMIQLAFTVFDNEILKQIEEIGIWINIKSGEIVRTENIIPHKAKKYIKSTTAINGVLNTTALFKYPGTINPRVRFDGYTIEEQTQTYLTTAIDFAEKEFAPLIKKLKDQLKNPLVDKTPFAFVQFKTIGLVGDDLVIEDIKGDRIRLIDAKEGGWFDTITTIKFIGNTVNTYNACLLRFKYLPEQGELLATPLTLVNNANILKLGF